ncbi:hypothetical protein [Salegentibacter maritimus]|uniref:hypothetical protein n=1 Tax=Salegentibacter maritimus TaxID=2794347 RepID=UPI0018E48507|nr:hypothetical protein [Salegentibacter maritimus]MBI6117952.1 hypothetical protein [Salegentibacter maritimus]
MEKLNSAEFHDVLKDIRSSYRLLALYQRRVLDVVKYIGNQYNFNFTSGWSKFSNASLNGTRASIEKWSWDWLSMYLYEFNMGKREINGGTYFFRIIHQADTGFFDENEKTDISKLDISKFGNVEVASTRLFLVLTKDRDGWPFQKNLLDNNLSKNSEGLICNENWMGVPYEMERFYNRSTTDKVLADFNQKVKLYFNIEILQTIEAED